MNRDAFGEGGADRERRVERPPRFLTTDPFGEVGRMENRVLQSHHGDSMVVFRAILKALTLPFWLPFWLRKRHLVRKNMVRIGTNWRSLGLSYGEMAIRWAERNPWEYPLGRYDPGVRKLEAPVQEISEKLAARKEYAKDRASTRDAPYGLWFTSLPPVAPPSLRLRHSPFRC